MAEGKKEKNVKSPTFDFFPSISCLTPLPPLKVPKKSGKVEDVLKSLFSYIRTRGKGKDNKVS